MSRAKTTKSGSVEKVAKSLDPRDPEKAQINIHGVCSKNQFHIAVDANHIAPTRELQSSDPAD